MSWNCDFPPSPGYAPTPEFTFNNNNNNNNNNNVFGASSTNAGGLNNSTTGFGGTPNRPTGFGNVGFGGTPNNSNGSFGFGGTPNNSNGFGFGGPPNSSNGQSFSQGFGQNNGPPSLSTFLNESKHARVRAQEAAERFLQQPTNTKLPKKIRNQFPGSISSIAWGREFLMCTTWDSKVHVVRNMWGTTQKLIEADFGGYPLLCGCALGKTWSVVAAGCDNNARLLDVYQEKQQPIIDMKVVAKHDQPIKAIKSVDDFTLITGSWDKRVCLWDIRQPNLKPAAKKNLANRVYSLDQKDNMVVIGIADRQVVVHDVRKMLAGPIHSASHLKFQVRSVKCFPDISGYLASSIAGRVRVEYLFESRKSFSFKCHRNNKDVYPVNGMSFHPLGTFATGGSDGSFCTWDKESKKRIHNGKVQGTTTPISAIEFSLDGTWLAYAQSYDYSMGKIEKPGVNSLNIIRVERAMIDEKNNRRTENRRIGRRTRR